MALPSCAAAKPLQVRRARMRRSNRAIVDAISYNNSLPPLCGRVEAHLCDPQSNTALALRLRCLQRVDCRAKELQEGRRRDLAQTCWRHDVHLALRGRVRPDK